MKLIVFTQKIDKDDTTLGFFHDWVIRLSNKFEFVHIICLSLGEYDMPENVKIYSLGKEKGVSKIGYIINLFKYLYELNGSYDRVFVHMNQEYVLLTGLYWKIRGIPVYFWRNHPSGSILTYISIFLSSKVFCTSTKSFTARFSKTVIMPAGINTDVFKQDPSFIRKKYSVCMIGRISPVKHIEIALEAFNILNKEGAQVSLSIIGDVPQINFNYNEELKQYIEVNNLSKVVTLKSGVTLKDLPEVYGSFEICLNLTEEGSFDKTIVEAASCGTIPLVSSSSFRNLLPDVCITDTVPENIAYAIKRLIDPTEQIKIQKDLEKFVLSQSLSSLMSKISQEIR